MTLIIIVFNNMRGLSIFNLDNIRRVHRTRLWLASQEEPDKLASIPTMLSSPRLLFRFLALLRARSAQEDSDPHVAS